MEWPLRRTRTTSLTFSSSQLWRCNPSSRGLSVFDEESFRKSCILSESNVRKLHLDEIFQRLWTSFDRITVYCWNMPSVALAKGWASAALVAAVHCSPHFHLLQSWNRRRKVNKSELSRIRSSVLWPAASHNIVLWFHYQPNQSHIIKTFHLFTSLVYFHSLLHSKQGL